MQAIHEPTTAPAVAPSTATDDNPGQRAPTVQRAAFGPVHSLLGGALPRLWRYALAQPDCSTPKRQRRKMRDLIGWLLVREGYRIRCEVQTPFSESDRLVRGRLELLVESRACEPLLAIESDWTLNEDSLRKLAAWRDRGVPTLWITGFDCKREQLYELRRTVNRTLRQDTGLWLPIYHLEHGWLRVRFQRVGGKPPGSKVTSELQGQSHPTAL